MKPQAHKPSDWDQIPAGGQEPLNLGPVAKIAVNALRFTVVAAVGLAILPFKVFAAFVSDDGQSPEETEHDSWTSNILSPTDSGPKLYLDPDSPDGLGGVPVSPDQEPYHFG